MRFKVLRGLGPRGYINIDDALLGGRGAAGPAGPAGAQGPAGDENSTPLSNTLFIDGGTSVPLANQNGSIGRPYSTVTAAMNALAGQALQNYILMPGDYSAEADIALLNTASARFSFFCLSSLYGIGGTSNETNARMPGIAGGAASQRVHFTNCLFNNKSCNPAGFLRADWCRFLGGPTVGITTGGFAVIMNYCELAQRITAGDGGFTGRNLVFNFGDTLITTSSTSIVAFFCQFPAAATDVTFTGAPGVFSVDSVSNFYWEAGTETITNGAKAIVGDLT